MATKAAHFFSRFGSSSFADPCRRERRGCCCWCRRRRRSRSHSSPMRRVASVRSSSRARSSRCAARGPAPQAGAPASCAPASCAAASRAPACFRPVPRCNLLSASSGRAVARAGGRPVSQVSQAHPFAVAITRTQHNATTTALAPPSFLVRRASGVSRTRRRSQTQPRRRRCGFLTPPVL